MPNLTVMSPQLQRAIKMLQISRMELVDMVREEMRENPILEDSVASANEQAKVTAGRQYTAEDPTSITPDVYIHKVGDQYSVVANDEGLPKLKISDFYRSALAASREERESIQGDAAQRAVADPFD